MPHVIIAQNLHNAVPMAHREPLRPGDWRCWTYHQPFKWHFLATMPQSGGTITQADIDAWLIAVR